MKFLKIHPFVACALRDGRTDRQADIKKLTVPFETAKAPKKKLAAC